MTYKIGWRSLRHICPSLSNARAKELAGDLGSAMKAFNITTPARAAHFLAQVAHESGEFRYREEIWGPTAAQRGYEHRRDLGNVVAGDGHKFRGRGYIQITGRMNYKSMSHSWGMGNVLVDKPGLVSSRRNAAKSAAWWWREHGLNRLVDKNGSVTQVTRVINGGYNGLSDREKYYKRANRVKRWLVPKKVT